MADSRRYGLRNQIDIRDILLEAQHRWLRPAEICQILENYKKFQIAPEPATMPPSGSLFLFDRKVLRYFRKDGHNWRKKKDGKTVKEAHERLKSGSVDVLHCYYAHGEENENFQRRSYWMLEEELSHIVLVHYLEVKGNRTHLHRNRETEESALSPLTEATNSYETNSASRYNIHQGKNQVPSQTTDTSSNSCPTSEFEDAESSYSNQASSSVQSAVQFEQAGSENHVPGAFLNGYQENVPVIPGMNFLSLTAAEINKNSGTGLTFEHPPQLELSSWEEVLGNLTHITGTVHNQEQDILGQLFADGIDKKQELGSQSRVKEEWQWLGNQKLQPDVVYEVTSGFEGQEVSHDDSVASDRHFSYENVDKTTVGNISARIEEKNSYPSPLKHAFSDVLADESLKKMDSFNRWMSKELDVSEIHMESSTGAGSYWDPVEGENVVNSNNSEEHGFTLSPSLSQDQLFSITDFVPNWGYAGLEVKVLITGKFLKTPEEVAKHKWSCMFGEVEVPAEIIADGVLCCHAPVHKVGRVPFYVTCSNRLACSEVREFEYCTNQFQEENTANSSNGSSTFTELLKMRFANLLCLSSISRSTSDLGDLVQKSQLSSKISSLLNDDNGEWDEMLGFTSEGSLDATREQMMQKMLKENLYAWLLDKAVEGGKGASVLDEEGQGVLHFAAALGYDWALQPTITAGVNVNFRDLKGWTALHWAAYCGRERTVGLLLSLGAAPGALTDPSPKYPTGRTATDLASSNGHKGIAGFLAESALSSHLSSLNLDNKESDAANSPGGRAVQTISERFPTPCANGELPSGLSMKDSLAAVCNATQAAARIHQVFRLQSFQRKVMKEYDDDNKFGISDERALSRLAVKQKKSGHDPAQAAAIRIQNKFRGWKGRKEFLIIRQQIVKIQAHVRGHQVRNKHKKITWSVGILEKVILRWRRKGSGLRGFKSEALTDASNMMNDNTSSNVEDDFDFLKEGRKQTEERMQKYLARVKSMVQYPEARDQYRRLLNVVSEIQEAKGIEEMVSVSYEGTAEFDDDISIDDLLDEADKYMPMLP